MALRGESTQYVERKVDSGVLKGSVSADGKVQRFLGVPYAAPPVGALRWKEPQAVEPWEGVRDATQFGPRAMQDFIWDDMFFNDPGPSEDCLYLNVWIPNKAEVKDLPVMFWIHGGGLVAGGTSEPRQEGSKLSTKGVIVVSVGYRMGIFGFMNHPELSKESPHGASGNYGLLDMVAALQWVQRNISEFGGDPKNVTIFGESAGSMSVSALMASPLAKGLFHKAIGESGAMFSSRRGRGMTPLTHAEKVSVAVLEEAFGTSDLATLRSLSAKRIQEVVWEKYRWNFSPIVDGYFLPKPAAEVFAAGEQNDVPLIAGWNLDEGSYETLLGEKSPTLKHFRQAAVEQFGDKAGAFLEAYAASNDAEAKRAAADYGGDMFIGKGTWEWIEAQRKTGSSPVYRYRFDQKLPIPESAPQGTEAKAAHSWEIEYVFRVLDSKALRWRSQDWVVSEMMAAYWTNFAKTGNPNERGLPKWPSYSEESDRPVLIITETPEVQSDVHRDRFTFLQSIE